MLRAVQWHAFEQAHGVAFEQALGVASACAAARSPGSGGARSESRPRRRLSRLPLVPFPHTQAPLGPPPLDQPAWQESQHWTSLESTGQVLDQNA